MTRDAGLRDAGQVPKPVEGLASRVSQPHVFFNFAAKIKLFIFAAHF
jgi:hypothetical protein